MSAELLHSCMCCKDCGFILTEEEMHYYEIRCEKCERAYDERVERWRRGGEDAELDAMFDEPRGAPQ